MDDKPTGRGREKEIRLILDEARPRFDGAMCQLEEYVDLICKRLSLGDFRLRLKEYRIKSVARCVEKIRRKNALQKDPLEVVEDIVGARVVVYNLSDQDRFVDAVRHDADAPFIDIRTEKLARPDGYHAIHMNGRLRRDPSIGCEVQALTVLQDAWAVTSRAYIYDESQSDDWLGEIMAAQSLAIHGSDRILQGIRDQVRRAETEKTTMVESMEAGRRMADEEIEFGPERTKIRVELSEAQRERYETLIHDLNSADRTVLDGHLSPGRVREFGDELTEMRAADSLRSLLEPVGAYEKRARYVAENRFGLKRTFLPKGPFIEEGNQARYRPHGFADPLDAFVQNRYTELLRTQLSGSSTRVSVVELTGFVERASRELEQHGYSSDLVVLSLTGDAKLSLAVAKVLDYHGEPTIRGKHLPANIGVNGSAGGLAALEVRTSIEGGSSVHILDLERFAGLEQTLPSPEHDEFLDVEVESVSEGRAIILARNMPVLFAHDRGRELSEEERILRLRMAVEFEVTEASAFRLRDGDQAVRGTWITEN